MKTKPNLDTVDRSQTQRSKSGSGVAAEASIAGCVLAFYDHAKKYETSKELEEQFVLYMLPPRSIFSNFNISFHSFADDLQNYLTLKSGTHCVALTTLSNGCL